MQAQSMASSKPSRKSKASSKPSRKNTGELKAQPEKHRRAQSPAQHTRTHGDRIPNTHTRAQKSVHNFKDTPPHQNLKQHMTTWRAQSPAGKPLVKSKHSLKSTGELKAQPNEHTETVQHTHSTHLYTCPQAGKTQASSKPSRKKTQASSKPSPTRTCRQNPHTYAFAKKVSTYKQTHQSISSNMQAQNMASSKPSRKHRVTFCRNTQRNQDPKQGELKT
jgi:hypothetical protein